MYFNEKDIKILNGLIIGDGCLRKTNNLKITHSIKQKEYVEYKAKLLHSIFGGKDIKLYYYKTSYNYNHNGVHEKRYCDTCEICKGSKHFKELYDKIYINGHKTITK